MIRVVGIGCRARAGEQALVEVIDAARAAAPGPLDRIATLAARAETDTIRALATRAGLPITGLDEGAIRDCATQTHSPRIEARFGTGSIAEAVALVAAGRNARLVCARVISQDGMATAAIAEGDGE